MKKSTSVLLWILAFLLMAGIATYQRMTGPTYPKHGSVTMNGEVIKFKLPTSTDTDGKDLISINVTNQNLIGYMKYRRFKSNDEWAVQQMRREGDFIFASIPKQPTAGKVMYQIYLVDFNGNHVSLTEEPMIIRFKGVVPPYILYPHILFMFMAMVISMRAGLDGMFKGNNTYNLSLWTMNLFIIGGILLGPTVQWYAFGAFWTGWPFGHDLTDNKTLIALIFWVIAVVRLKNHPERRKWAVIASLVLLAVYLIPHSVLGSEIDYTKLPK